MASAMELQIGSIRVLADNTQKHKQTKCSHGLLARLCDSLSRAVRIFTGVYLNSETKVHATWHMH